jgi:DNA (cytosine-5)-methyltransferase 1
MKSDRQYKFIDLFSGVGGFHLGLKEKGHCVYACEWDKNARKTYAENFGAEMSENNVRFDCDITKVDPNQIPDHHILAAGFPCQPFSIAGSQKGFKHETQGNLFFNIEEILKVKRPEIVLLENVKNLVSHDNGKTFEVIKSKLEKIGYQLHYKVLNSSKHGNIPQNRERIFIIGLSPLLGAKEFVFPPEIPLTQTLENSIEKTRQKEKYYCDPNKSEALKKIVTGTKKEGIIYQYRRYYIRENKNGVCPTLTANMGSGGHNVPFIRDTWGVRKLTPRECFNLQGFPKSFKLAQIGDSSLYKQAGNSVTIPVIKALAKEIYKILDDHEPYRWR